jgi:hypothetical protein
LPEGTHVQAIFLEDLDDHPPRVDDHETASGSVKSKCRGEGDALPIPRAGVRLA